MRGQTRNAARTHRSRTRRTHATDARHGRTRRSRRRTADSLEADLGGLDPQPVSAAPFTEYGSRTRKGVPGTRPLAAPLNVFSPYAWYDLSDGADPLDLTVGQADPQLGRSEPYLRLIEFKRPVGAWTYQSPPVAAQNRPYWVARS
ncbi:hypothetical protein [Streptomyces sp. enrichment culture]|uniref:hypothetical protein n=1 Tax=Streptomyces sp. enrichment culture TaxID=1795815 RepID=UPI003F56F2C5